MKIWESKLPGTLCDTPGLLRDCFTFTLTYWNPLGHSRPVMGLLYLYHVSLGRPTRGYDDNIKIILKKYVKWLLATSAWLQIMFNS